MVRDSLYTASVIFAGAGPKEKRKHENRYKKKSVQARRQFKQKNPIEREWHFSKGFRKNSDISSSTTVIYVS